MTESVSFLAYQKPISGPLQRDRTLIRDHRAGREYHASDALKAAMDAAMLLGMPLLLTGEPGSGKTQAAYWLSRALGEEDRARRPRLLRTDVKSTMSGRDLLYRFDEVARFRDSAAGGSPRPLIEYLEFEALGEAIIRAGGGRATLLPLGSRDADEIAERAFGQSHGDLRASNLLPGDPAFAKSLPECRVVLIDELDKAPRDTPNDLLAEIENMSFSIPELGIRIDSRGESDLPDQRPIVIITSNSERDLPEPFLRRCAYCHIDFPGEGAIKAIARDAVGRLAKAPDFGMLDSATQFLFLLRRSSLSRAPGTAEFLAWCACLADADFGLPLDRGFDTATENQRNRIIETLGLLVKNEGDLAIARQKLSEFRPVS
jgi:MoxR-like ATPase